MRVLELKKLLSLLVIAWALQPIQSFAQDRVLAASATSTGSLTGLNTEVHGIVVESSATAGTLELFDDAAAPCTGVSLVTIHTPAAAGLDYIPIPGVVRFVDGVCAILTNVNGVTIFYK